MSRRLFISTVVFAIALGAIVGYIRGMPDDFVDVPDMSIDYGYRCGDGSEFTIEPSENMLTITIVPATSVDYLVRTELALVDDLKYAGAGVTFVPNGTFAELTSASSAPTTCTSMNSKENTLFK
ncbi:MAG: hypothetical protein KBD06_02280 [Candidatus Pacebacteria bacterium]|nr:hypothetical protein [Candidatus Paceibacterota bacterium]